jgi:hypothetical protein
VPTRPPGRSGYDSRDHSPLALVPDSHQPPALWTPLQELLFPISVFVPIFEFYATYTTCCTNCQVSHFANKSSNWRPRAFANVPAGSTVTSRCLIEPSWKAPGHDPVPLRFLPRVRSSAQSYGVFQCGISELSGYWRCEGVRPGGLIEYEWHRYENYPEGRDGTFEDTSGHARQKKSIRTVP